MKRPDGQACRLNGRLNGHVEEAPRPRPSCMSAPRSPPSCRSPSSASRTPPLNVGEAMLEEHARRIGELMRAQLMAARGDSFEAIEAALGLGFQRRAMDL